MKRKLFLLVLISTFSTLISAQTPTYDPRMDLPKVTPPSPNAATLGKYGDIAVGLYAGTPNVSIPVYDIKLGSFSLPVNVSYHCQGLKVEEKSGNIGLNWALNAGGVITRTVKGLPDENGLGYWSHATWTNHYISSDELRTEAFCNGTYDAQPDMFYFNFGSYSGKFVVDATSAHVAHIIPDQPGIQIKVMDNALSSFQITDDKGIQYIFDVKETTTDDNSPPTILNYTSAWYLSKIITPAGNITFTYANDQTYFNQYVESDHLNGIASEDAAKFNPGWKVANNVITVDSRILTGITTPVETLKFYTLADRKDMTGARRITECVVQDYNTKVLKKIIFNQSYFGNSTTTSPEDCRLKLDQIREYSADSTTYKAYSFNYNGPGQVPSVKSLSQDFWGYYNGKANASLLPNLDLPTWGSYIVGQITHYGDRTPDVNYAMIGCLNQITYPTGGTTQFTYESNDYSYVNGAPLNDPLQTVHQVSASATENSTTNIPTTTTNFTINAAQTVTVTTQGSYSGAPPVENGPSVAINLINADGSRTNISTRSMINSTITTTQALAVGNYEIISSVDGATQTATGTVQYYSLDGYIHTKVAGGIRIQKVLNTDPITSLTTQKTYSYKSATDATLSSGVLVSPINLVSLKYNFVYIWVLRSATTTNYLGTTQGNFIGYGRVSETEGTGSNGRKDSYFTTAFDYPNTLGTDSLIHDLNSVVASNVDDYKNKYLNDYDACRGFLTKELTYNSANALLKETDIQYNIPAALTPTSANYFQLNSKAGLSNYMCIINCAQCYCPSSPQIPCLTCSPFGVDMFYVFDNQIVCPWIYKTQTTETQYDQSGNNPVTMLTNFYYDNPLHGQVTRVELTNSKGIVVKTLNKYAQDKSAINNLTATASLAVDAMVSKNMVSNVLESEHYTNGVFNSRLRTNYRIWDANGMIVSPENVQFQTQLSSALETRSQFTNYDSKGNLLEDSKFNGPTTSYQWGYNFHYPVAQVVNSKSKDSFYDGFEEGDGNSTDAKTGHYSHTGTYTQSLTSLDNGYYTLTYWLKSGGVWSFQTISINVTTGAYTINLTGQIDDVRFYSAYGEMTTYTYDPLVGVTSSTDAKGEIIYYEYDSFQRLQNIKDKDGNIIKSFTYHYQGQ